MIRSTREKGIEAKQEGDGNHDNKRFTKAPAPPSSSRQWSTFRNPRIVRVSRSFGGKDRHSKVCTVRGLRDRRIRLSVPTAIQLYDLQDRLGLSQPSKVIDWLIDATKNDIDKLPPLQLPQGFGHHFHQQMLLSNEFNSSQSSLAPFFDPNSTFNKDIGFHSLGIKANSSSATLHGDDQGVSMAKAKYWEAEAETSLRATASVGEKGKWIKTNDQHNQDGVVSAQNLFPLASTHSSFPSLLNNPMPYNSYYHWDASNLSLSQFGTSHHHGFVPQTENSSLNTNTSSVSLPGSQFFLCPPPTIPSLFPQYPPYVATPMETNESRETNHFQGLTSSSGNNPTKSFSLNANQGLALHHSQKNNSGSQPHKDINADS